MKNEVGADKDDLKEDNSEMTIATWRSRNLK